MKQEIEKVRQKVEEYFNLYYKKSLKDLTITDTPGYWKDEKYNYYYEDNNRDYRTGKFTSPYKSWRLLRQEFLRRKKEWKTVEKNKTIYPVSTKDYIINHSSGNYVANFIDDETIEKYKIPGRKKEE